MRMKIFIMSSVLYFAIGFLIIMMFDMSLYLKSLFIMILILVNGIFKDYVLKMNHFDFFKFLNRKNNNI
ncbi:hypothetical protein GCM10010896_15900 [Mammaliicoccus stepanovicii]|uniref:Uncharacterized protein n=1 Tax=Mammaliicoccus stepanovicii TaxID=643214 RepID=A0A239ZGN1_9STAP|nr:hypothetical protein CD111_12300 [Mammaliicoccus stepanovicii]GGI41934.1 hypothetical protein GCM10010896_15900 [Mammaliicoccus stepanovicii]SNV69706.1 Uncharacterised protein [Mammaliicoccus stepanovicii]